MNFSFMETKYISFTVVTAYDMIIIYVPTLDIYHLAGLSADIQISA